MKAIFSQRVRIPTGLDCNEKCKFCYYYSKLNTQRYTTEQMMDKLDYAKVHGIKDIDFSGGEPTIRLDLPELISKAAKMGFRKICVITNGTRTQDKDYFKSLIDSGLNEVLLSVHGHSAETHDTSVQRKGSWEAIKQSVANCHEFKIRLRTNTVVTKLNFNTLDKIAEYLITTRPVASNFICFNDWNNAAALVDDLACKYSEAAPGLHKAINLMDKKISKVTVRYIPFCFMKGYEKHVCGLLQNEFDGDEWVDPIKTVVTFEDVYGEESQKYYKKLFESFSGYKQNILKGVKEKFSNKELENSAIFEDLPAKYMALAYKTDRAVFRSSYVKGSECANCALNKICDGLEKSYSDFIGIGELKKTVGKPIEDFMHFRGEYSNNWK